jgi:protein-S-isoprenylcysteine O-methyltransferase Ste14
MAAVVRFQESKKMPAFAFLAYSLCTYLFFFAAFLYFIAFVGGLPVPIHIDAGRTSGTAQAILFDLLLLATFGVQHSVMARASFKRVWTLLVPRPIERSTFVLASTLALALLMWQWRSISEPVLWEFTGAFGVALQCVFWAGWGVMLASSFLIDHFDLFGVSQAWHHARKTPAATQQLRTPAFYKYVRHPLYAGVLMGIWGTPRMTAGHFLFALGLTIYTLVGIYFEERDLVAQFGAAYLGYQKRVGMLLPRLWGRLRAWLVPAPGKFD